MPAGITVYNNDGYIQVTDLAKNFVLLSKGTVALDGTAYSDPPGITGSHATIVIPNTLGYCPIIAIRCNTAVVPYRCRLISGNWNYELVSVYGTNKTDVVEWFAFGPPVNTTMPAFGLEIRTAAGELAFHSSLKPMNIKQFQSQALGSSGSFAIASGRKIAIAMATMSWSWSPQVPAGTWQQFMSAMSILTPTAAQHQATFASITCRSTFSPINYGFPGGSTGSWSAYALDVTNY
jgi:hypothetical protein